MREGRKSSLSGAQSDGKTHPLPLERARGEGERAEVVAMPLYPSLSLSFFTVIQVAFVTRGPVGRRMRREWKVLRAFVRGLGDSVCCWTTDGMTDSIQRVQS